jgi:phosphate acetyltransferase
MMVEKELADGMISGINSETKPYFPAFEIIKTREGISRASGLFIMVNGKKTYLFADCALNMNPTAEQLSEIAYTTAQTAISFGIKPKIAMLSFSTHGTAKHELVDKIVKATVLLKEKDKDLIIDGEIQLDAAIIPEVAAKKCKDSPLAGEANILIFPDLNSGNIGYKLTERLGEYKAIGPIMQGLNKPINDLSRGASVQDIVDLAVITVIQGL